MLLEGVADVIVSQFPFEIFDKECWEYYLIEFSLRLKFRHGFLY